MRYASFWKRMNAYGYDVLIVQLAALMPMFAFFHFPSLETIVQTASLGEWGAWYTRFWIALSALYNIAYVAAPGGATPGKHYCGIRVVNRDGSRLNLRQSALRHLASGIGGVTWGIAFLTAAFTRQRLAPHDMLCGTRVILVTPPQANA